MNATGLPIPTSGIAAALPAAPPASTPAAAPADFLLMLGQLLGGTASQNAAGAAKTTLPASTASPESEPAESEDGDALAMLSLPMMPWSTQQNQPAPAAADAAGSLGLMSLGSGGPGSRRDSVGNDALLLASLTETMKADDARTTLQANLNPQQSLEAAQSQRAVTAGDAAGTRALHHPVGSSAWADELGTRMTLMADRGQHSASLRLSPEHLGPLEVRIAVRDDQASVWFGAAHADTRAAIEQALPRLRELFAAQGMSLADAGVSQEAPREQPRLSSGATSSGDAAAVEEADAIAQVGPIRLGLVDAYA